MKAIEASASDVIAMVVNQNLFLLI